MPGEKPSAAARETAAAILAPTCIPLAVNVIDDIASALDAALAQGRREREAEIVEWLREEAFAWTAGKCADELERGAGRKESV